MNPRIATYNIKGQRALVDGDHVEKLAEVIRGLVADIAGLQEVHRRTWQSRFRDQCQDWSNGRK